MPDDFIAIEEQSKCYLCGNSGETLYAGLKDFLFGSPGQWSFKKCTNSICRLVWLDPAPTPDTISKVYQNYYTHGQPSSERYTNSARLLRFILYPFIIFLLRMRSARKAYKNMYLDQFAIAPGRLLEVGCGSGKRLHRMRVNGWDVMGQEVDLLAARHVSKRYNIPVYFGSLESMPENINKFDVVIMSHVIEHVHDPVELLTACRRFLKEGGLLIVMTPNVASFGHRKFGQFWRGLEPPRHLHLFDCHTLCEIVRIAGFKQYYCWTTIVGANGIGQGSHLPIKKGASGARIFTLRDVLRGLWFQIAAAFVHRKAKDSGEECVLMAYK